MNFSRSSVLALLPLAALCVGCADGPVKPNPEAVAALRERYVLDAEPADAQTALDWRESQAGDAQPESADSGSDNENAPPSSQIVLVGQVGGMPNPWGKEHEPAFPWKEGQSTFFLVDPSTAAEFADHAAAEGLAHAEDCPFCSREAAEKTDAIAVVSFADEEGGDPAKIDTRDAFPIAEGDLVVVRGKWELIGDLLMIDADGIYRRP